MSLLAIALGVLIVWIAVVLLAIALCVSARLGDEAIERARRRARG